MSLDVFGDVNVGQINVRSISNRGFTIEELAEQALEKIIYVGDNADPVIRQQAEAFKDRIRDVLLIYLAQAIRSHNTTVANRLKSVGHEELIKLLEI